MAQYVFSMNRVGKIVPPKRHILKDISLSFFPGAKIGVLGTNGSGKSTLLRIMAGLDKEIEGEAIPMPGLNIGYLPQEPQLDPDKTVRETVEEAMGKVLKAKARLEEVYIAYGAEDADFDALFTTDKPIVFAYHGYPWLIHRLTYRRRNHNNLHVRGYKEEGTTSTPFDMVVMNELDRFNLADDVIDRVPALQKKGARVKTMLQDKLIEHKLYIREHGIDMPEIRAWKWPY